MIVPGTAAELATSPGTDEAAWGIDGPDPFVWRELAFKVADRPEEREQIHRLNHRTFAGEIPQHPASPDGRLIDKFDAENTYLICLHGDRLVGMIAVRGTRPFSLDGKLPDLDAHLPPHRSVCEFRLLAVDPDHRSGRVLLGLMGLLRRHCLGQGYDLGLISGTTRQRKLYRHLGFVPFGPLVGAAGAQFQPMYLTLDNAEAEAVPHLAHLPGVETAQHDASLDRARPPARLVNLLPGPVAVAPAVAAAFRTDLISHRSEAFLSVYRGVRARLRGLVGAESVALLHGSGTLANDAVAARLASLGRPGLVLSNGEFGERLIDTARRVGLQFAAVHRPEEAPITGADLETRLADGTEIGWVWLVHCETSTGVLNDLDGVRAVARRRGIALCVDAVSSIGTVPVDLTGVAMASGVSGKGLASYAGLAMVYADAPLDRPMAGATGLPLVPRYLDLAAYAGDAPPYTVPSNLVFALDAALDRVEDPSRRECITRTARALRTRLVELGFALVADERDASPAVITVALPPACPAEQLGDALRERGYLLSYQSGYLRARNRIQICLMGEVDPADVVPLPDLMAELAGPR